MCFGRHFVCCFQDLFNVIMAVMMIWYLWSYRRILYSKGSKRIKIIIVYHMCMMLGDEMMKSIVILCSIIKWAFWGLFQMRWNMCWKKLYFQPKNIINCIKVWYPDRYKSSFNSKNCDTAKWCVWKYICVVFAVDAWL